MCVCVFWLRVLVACFGIWPQLPLLRRFAFIDRACLFVCFDWLELAWLCVGVALSLQGLRPASRPYDVRKVHAARRLRVVERRRRAARLQQLLVANRNYVS